MEKTYFGVPKFMDAKKVSVMITVKNEPEALQKLLNSLAAQTTLPQEVVITDASNNHSVEKSIASWQKNHKHISLQIIKAEGVNRATGRNIAIRAAKNSSIAVTDAGCIAKNDWLEKITSPIKKGNADSVGGFYHAACTNLFQRTIAPFVAIMPDTLNTKTFLPSSRSLAFTKKAWAKVGGYPEQYNYCEDLIFAKNLKNETRLVIEPKAIVDWQQAENLIEFYHQIRNYATGAVEAVYLPHLAKIATVYLRYVVFVAIPPLFFAYLLIPIYKHLRFINHPLALFLLPIVQIVSDAAVIAGSLKAAIKKITR